MHTCSHKASESLRQLTMAWHLNIVCAADNTLLADSWLLGDKGVVERLGEREGSEGLWDCVCVHLSVCVHTCTYACVDVGKGKEGQSEICSVLLNSVVYFCSISCIALWASHSYSPRGIQCIRNPVIHYYCTHSTLQARQGLPGHPGPGQGPAGWSGQEAPASGPPPSPPSTPAQRCHSAHSEAPGRTAARAGAHLANQKPLLWWSDNNEKHFNSE